MIEVINLKMSNCYLIKSENNDDYILVDTSVSDVRDDLFERVKDLKVRAIVLTHGHVDHAGNAKYLCDYFNCPCLMHKEDVSIITNNDARERYCDSFIGKILMRLGNKSNETKVEMPSNIINVSHDDTLAKYGFDNVKIIGLPGHTRGSIGLLVNKKDLIVGDTLMNWKKPISTMFYEEKGSQINSLELIKDILPSKLYPGHGDVFNYEDFFKMEKLKNLRNGNQGKKNKKSKRR